MVIVIIISLIFFIQLDKMLTKKKDKNKPIISNQEKKETDFPEVKQFSNVEENYSQTNRKTFDYKKYYRPKRYIVTINELNFYNVLMEIVQELNLVLFSQVSLYNILQTKPNLDYKTKTICFNRICSKSIDFVLVDKKDCRIRLCIELDDRTHKQPKRIERDRFINELFQSLEINLLRYPVYPVYYKETLKRKITQNLAKHYYVN